MRDLTLDELQHIYGGSTMGTVTGLVVGGAVGFLGSGALAVSAIVAPSASVSAMILGAPVMIIASVFGALIGGFIGNTCGNMIGIK